MSAFTQNPVSNCDALEFLRKNTSFPEPVTREDMSGHFCNFFDYLTGPVGGDRCIAFKHTYADLKELLGSVYCSKCPNYLFTSKKDRAVHNSLMHKRKKVNCAKKRKTSK